VEHGTQMACDAIENIMNQRRDVERK
jgi:hypothetical protein